MVKFRFWTNLTTLFTLLDSSLQELDLKRPTTSKDLDEFQQPSPTIRPSRTCHNLIGEPPTIFYSFNFSIQIYSNLYKNVRCRWCCFIFKRDQNKNLGQNKDNLINYLSKDYVYSKESANRVIEKAVKENVVRIALFDGKNSYKIVENGENTMIVPETQLNDTQLNDADATEAISEEKNALAIEETVVGTPAHMLNDEIISTLEKKV